MTASRSAAASKTWTDGACSGHPDLHQERGVLSRFARRAISYLIRGMAASRESHAQGGRNAAGVFVTQRMADPALVVQQGAGGELRRAAAIFSGSRASWRCARGRTSRFHRSAGPVTRRRRHGLLRRDVPHDLLGQPAARGRAGRVGVGPAELISIQPLEFGVRNRRHTPVPPGSVVVAPAAAMASGGFPLAGCLPALAPARRARTSPMASCWLAGSCGGRWAWIW